MADKGHSSKVHAPLKNKPGVSNWVEDAGGLPPYIKRIAKHLVADQGFTTSRAIATAVNQVKKWAKGGGDVKPATRAKALKALAQWTAMKAKSKATSNNTSDAIELAGKHWLKQPRDPRNGRWIDVPGIGRLGQNIGGGFKVGDRVTHDDRPGTVRQSVKGSDPDVMLDKHNQVVPVDTSKMKPLTENRDPLTWDEDELSRRATEAIALGDDANAQYGIDLLNRKMAAKEARMALEGYKPEVKDQTVKGKFKADQRVKTPAGPGTIIRRVDTSMSEQYDVRIDGQSDSKEYTYLAADLFSMKGSSVSSTPSAPSKPNTAPITDKSAKEIEVESLTKSTKETYDSLVKAGYSEQASFVKQKAIDDGVPASIFDSSPKPVTTEAVKPVTYTPKQVSDYSDEELQSKLYELEEMHKKAKLSGATSLQKQIDSVEAEIKKRKSSSSSESDLGQQIPVTQSSRSVGEQGGTSIAEVIYRGVEKMVDGESLTFNGTAQVIKNGKKWEVIDLTGKNPTKTFGAKGKTHQYVRKIQGTGWVDAEFTQEYCDTNVIELL